MEGGQTTQRLKEKGQKDKQRSTKHTHKANDRVIRTPLNTRGKLWCSVRLGSCCSASGTRRVNLVTNPLTGVTPFREEHILFEYSLI